MPAEETEKQNEGGNQGQIDQVSAAQRYDGKVVTPDLAEVLLTNHPAHLFTFICFLPSLFPPFAPFSSHTHLIYRALKSLLTKAAEHILNPVTDTNITADIAEFNVTYYSAVLMFS